MFSPFPLCPYMLLSLSTFCPHRLKDSQALAATSDPANEKEAAKKKATFITTVDKC